MEDLSKLTTEELNEKEIELMNKIKNLNKELIILEKSRNEIIELRTKRCKHKMRKVAQYYDRAYDECILCGYRTY
jgi:hypothetical protein